MVPAEMYSLTRGAQSRRRGLGDGDHRMEGVIVAAGPA